MKKRALGIVILIAMIIVSIMPDKLADAAVKINKNKATMEVDSILTLSVSSAKKVSWKSSNKSIAKVTKKGKVTALSEGTARITATVNKKKYTCIVNVVDSNKETVGDETPTPTPTPELIKKEKEIEITLDNWQDYFEFKDYEDKEYNGFGELVHVTTGAYFKIKDNYELSKESTISIDFSYNRYEIDDTQENYYSDNGFIKSGNSVKTVSLTPESPQFAVIKNHIYIKGENGDLFIGPYEMIRIKGTLYVFDGTDESESTTPIHTEKAIEITLDNWQDYFVIEREEDWRYDAFGDFKELDLCNVFKLKEEYVSRFADKSKIAVELSYCEKDNTVELDDKSKTYSVNVKIGGGQSKTKKAVFELPNSTKIPTRYCFYDSFSAIEWDDSGKEFLAMYQYPMDIAVTRIQGTLYLYDD